jgi:DNA (cytosine-5)-methyltransferase 1
LRTADFFAGVGGVRLGLEQAGFKNVFSNDFDKFCKITYDLNSRQVKQTLADIRNIKGSDIPDFDLLAGGFPCQAFSVAGYRDGFEDKKGRGNLFFEILRIIDEKKKKPEIIFLENVKNLIGHDSGNTYKIIKRDLESFGYAVTERVLNSMHYGKIPQTRERVYIIGFKHSETFHRFEWPEPATLDITFHDCLEKEVDSRFYYNNKPLYHRLRESILNKDTVYQWRRKYVRENKKRVCPTLTANMGTGGHNVPIIKDSFGIRKLTPSECFRLQAFPRSFKLPPELADCHLYKQAGNSVTVSVIRSIAENIRKAVEGVNLKRGQLELQID